MLSFLCVLRLVNLPFGWFHGFLAELLGVLKLMHPPYGWFCVLLGVLKLVEPSLQKWRVQVDPDKRAASLTGC